MISESAQERSFQVTAGTDLAQQELQRLHLGDVVVPGTACHFKIFDLTRDKIAGLAGLADIHHAIQAHPEYAYLGAIGPSLADFIPGTRAQNHYLDIWAEVFSLIGDGMRVEKGLLSIIRDVGGLLAQLEPIANAEDRSALMGLKDKLGTITQAGDQLQAIFDQIPLIILPIGVGIMSGMRPAVNPFAPPPAAVPPSRFWELRNYLFWKKPGDFAKTLLQKARDSGDTKNLAYAYGYLVSYVADVTGSPFVNSTVGGPYRTQWWRHRWVNNYIDAWVYGKYESGATMSGDTPTPPYDQWPSLCAADLHKKMALGDHDPADLMRRLYQGQPLSDSPILPTSFAQLWVDAFKEAYNNPLPPVGQLTAENINDAYLMTWLILWFQTSKDGLGCNPAPPMSPPADCGAEPSWVKPKPAESGGTVTVPAPPEPEIETDPDVGKIISGIILALLGGGFVFTGNLAAGGAAIGLGIEEIIEGATEPDWKKLRCDIHWYKLYLFHALEALHEILSVAAFRHPYAAELAHDTTMSIYFSDFVAPYDSGKAVTKSRVGERFPAKPWSAGFNWMNLPTDLEPDATVAYRTVAYPSFFVDDAANPLSNGEVRVAGVWPVRTTTSSPGAKAIPVQFGNAVDNAIDMFRHLANDFPDWNLDADRGLAYHTWKFLNDIYTDPVSIDHED